MVLKYPGKICLFILYLLISYSVNAETGYIINRIKVGVHSEANLDSPIIKLLATGAQFEVLQRGVDMSQIKDPDGTTGWINTAYIIDKNVTTGNQNQNQEQQQALESLKQKFNQAQQEIASLKQQVKTAAANSPEPEELTSLRLKVGELQAKLTEERISANKTDQQEFEDYIKEVESKNANLQKKLIEQQSNNTNSNNQLLSHIATPGGLVLLIVLLVIGMVLGILLYDFYKRQQHGGFRI